MCLEWYSPSNIHPRDIHLGGWYSPGGIWWRDNHDRIIIWCGHFGVSGEMTGEMVESFVEGFGLGIWCMEMEALVEGLGGGVCVVIW